MKELITYQTSDFPMGMYPGAADADYGKRGCVFNSEEDFG